MVSEYDKGKAALDDLIGWVESEAAGTRMNEAETRLKVIDRILFDVLRWPRTTAQLEAPVPDGYIDYTLGAPGVVLVVEAKREGVYFQLPTGTTTGTHSIQGLIGGSGSKPLRDAVAQVATYAAHSGVAPAAVTNGHQFVAFLAVRTDGTPPLRGRALVFPSLAEMRADFRLFWDSLSPGALDARQLHRTLRAPAAAPPPDKLSGHIPRYPGFKRRSDLQAGLEILGELFLEDVAKLDEARDSFLRDCYASSGALSQHAALSRQILQARYSLIESDAGWQTSPVQSKRGTTPELSADALAAAASRRPIVLLGDVGVGKSTFIQRLVHVDASDLFAQAISLYIDFGTTSTMSTLERHVVESCIEQLRLRYSVDIEDATFAESVHREALNRFDRGVLARLKDVDPVAYSRERILHLQKLVEDRAAHLQASLVYLTTTRRKQVVIFLDNIDQRSSDDQNRVFLISNELAERWPATVFVTLRPDTFNSSTREGAVSGYHPRVFTIAPPRTDVMLQRRVDFALTQLRQTGRLSTYPVGVSVDSESMEAFLEVLADNFRSNDDLIRLIDNLAGGNMRLALQFVTDFLGSGHIDTSRILESYASRGRYVIPVHEFLRSLLFAQHIYFDPSSSPIVNIFDVSKPDGREHFLVCLLLAQAEAVGERFTDEGFVSASELYSFAHDLGFDADQASEALDRAREGRLLEESPQSSSKGSGQRFRVTTVGAYTIRTLVAYFAYLDAVVIDTPIVDESYRRLLIDNRTLRERVERAEYFRVYLDKQWGKLGASADVWDWSAVSSALREDINRVARLVDPSTWGYAR